jgi:hypothetical protein
MKRRIRIKEIEISLEGRLVSLFQGHGPVCNEYRRTFPDEKSAEEYYSSIILRMEKSS